MYRLAELDADSAGLVRVIDYFDALVRHGSDTASLLRASAQLADCVVGIEIVERGRSKKNLRRCDPRGRWSPEPQITTEHDQKHRCRRRGSRNGMDRTPRGQLATRRKCSSTGWP